MTRRHQRSPTSCAARSPTGAPGGQRPALGDRTGRRPRRLARHGPPGPGRTARRGPDRLPPGRPAPGVEHHTQPELHRTAQLRPVGAGRRAGRPAVWSSTRPGTPPTRTRRPCSSSRGAPRSFGSYGCGRLDGEPVLLERTVYAGWIAPAVEELPDGLRVGHPGAPRLHRPGLRPRRAPHRRARGGYRGRRELRVRRGSPLLRVRRTTTTAEGRPGRDLRRPLPPGLRRLHRPQLHPGQPADTHPPVSRPPRRPDEERSPVART